MCYDESYEFSEKCIIFKHFKNLIKTANKSPLKWRINYDTEIYSVWSKNVQEIFGFRVAWGSFDS